MATYKVIQDIEAEDKFIGPLTLRQFVFAMVGAFFGYLNFLFLTKGIVWTLAIFVPPMAFGLFMAIPWSKVQPTGVWVLAKLRFLLKPKKRIWDQAGLQELVTVTVPKKIEKQLTKNLSQKEVKSRLRALADTIDSRGWATKNATLEESLTDRLVTPAPTTSQPPAIDPSNVADMLDEGTDPRLSAMMQEREEMQKAKIAEKMERARKGEALKTLDQPKAVIAAPSEHLTKQVDEELITENLKAKKSSSSIATGRMHSINAEKPKVRAKKSSKKQGVSAMTEPLRPDIINLARNNDLNVATIQRQAGNNENDAGEVVVSLHSR